MSQLSITAETRDSAGKGVARKLRAQGSIPGVLYGRDASPSLFSIGEKPMIKLIKEHGLNSILELELGGKKHTCMIAEYQTDVFGRRLMHLDLKLVDLATPIVVKVPVEMTGVQAVRSRGGIAQLYMREMKVKVLPTAIPPQIDIDISDMQPGESRKLETLPVPENVTKMDPPSTMVVNILAPRALAAARVATDDEEAAEEEA